jgi:hypothetical protein
VCCICSEAAIKHCPQLIVTRVGTPLILQSIEKRCTNQTGFASTQLILNYFSSSTDLERFRETRLRVLHDRHGGGQESCRWISSFFLIASEEEEEEEINRLPWLGQSGRAAAGCACTAAALRC